MKRLHGEYRSLSIGIRPSQWTLHWDKMSSVVVPVPHKGEQVRLLAEIEASISRTRGVVSEAVHLKNLLIERRAALITDVITGKKEIA